MNIQRHQPLAQLTNGMRSPTGIPSRCTCKRRTHLDRLGMHLLHCPKGGTIIRRHNAIQQEIFALASSAGVQPSACNKDVVVLNETGDNRRGDLMLPQLGKDGRNLLLDFTITHPACNAYLRNTRINPESAISRAEDAKNDKYKDRAAALDIEFMPMAIECYGALSTTFIALLRRLCAKRADMIHGNVSAITEYWFRRMSCTIQRGNALAISNRIVDITQTTSNLNDECYDPHTANEVTNIDTFVNDNQ